VLSGEEMHSSGLERRPLGGEGAEVKGEQEGGKRGGGPGRKYYR